MNYKIEAKLISDNITNYLKNLGWNDDDIKYTHSQHIILIKLFKDYGINSHHSKFPEVLRTLAMGMDLGHEILKKYK